MRTPPAAATPPTPPVPSAPPAPTASTTAPKLLTAAQMVALIDEHLLELIPLKRRALKNLELLFTLAVEKEQITEATRIAALILRYEAKYPPKHAFVAPPADPDSVPTDPDSDPNDPARDDSDDSDDSDDPDEPDDQKAEDAPSQSEVRNHESNPDPRLPSAPITADPADSLTVSPSHPTTVSSSDAPPPSSPISTFQFPLCPASHRLTPSPSHPPTRPSSAAACSPAVRSTPNPRAL